MYGMHNYNYYVTIVCFKTLRIVDELTRAGSVIMCLKELSIKCFLLLLQCTRLITETLQYQKDPYEFTFVPEVCNYTVTVYKPLKYSTH